MNPAAWPINGCFWSVQGCNHQAANVCKGLAPLHAAKRPWLSSANALSDTSMIVSCAVPKAVGGFRSLKSKRLDYRARHWKGTAGYALWKVWHGRDEGRASNSSVLVVEDHGLCLVVVDEEGHNLRGGLQHLGYQLNCCVTLHSLPVSCAKITYKEQEIPGMCWL